MMFTGKSRLTYKFIIPIVLLTFIFACSQVPALAESYFRFCYPAIATILSFINRWVAFSLFDAGLIAAIILCSGSIIMMIFKRLSFSGWLKKVLLSVLWILVWFYLAWGIGYFRPDFFTRFELEPPKEDRIFFEAFVNQYIDLLNQSYVSDPQFDVSEVDRDVEVLYKKYHEALRLPYPCGWRRTKKTLIEPLMTRVGVSGFFGPFFNEVHVNNYSLPISYPYTLAHEKAHQFGITGEAECNLYATLICTSSDYPVVRYSGYLQTVSYLLGNLRKISPEQYREIAGRIDPRIIADYREIYEHWQKAYHETLSKVQEKAYDSYLKTNKQRSGILSYSEMTGLLIAYREMMEK
ncbi:MAG: DUF3810 domain-containing protein [Tannerella sp.]|jgi:hypothetical protein|nr:DUF3810 domain-containing protein [Tannerella sp.]